MKKVKKIEGAKIQAFCLGKDCPKINELLDAGLIKRIDGGKWRVFSQESSEGEVALNGDYIKLDSSGRPYPNSRDYFLKNHRHIAADVYEQIPHVLNAWSLEDGMCPEIEFLIKEKGLTIHEDNEKAYFTAPLWGDILSAAKDAVIVFYYLQYGKPKEILDADFNFIERSEFHKTYVVL